MERFWCSVGLTIFVAILLVLLATTGHQPALTALAEETSVPAAGYTDSGTTSDGLTWAFYPDGTLTISGTGCAGPYRSD